MLEFLGQLKTKRGLSHLMEKPHMLLYVLCFHFHDAKFSPNTQLVNIFARRAACSAVLIWTERGAVVIRIMGLFCEIRLQD
jgi:hypothetical protein